MSQYDDAHIFIKQHLSNIWSSVLIKKVKQHWGWVEKKTLHVEKACTHGVFVGSGQRGLISPFSHCLFLSLAYPLVNYELETTSPYTLKQPY